MFHFFGLFSFHRGTAPNPIQGYAENFGLLESGLWFTPDTAGKSMLM
jgi:hypothetical protein